MELRHFSRWILLFMVAAVSLLSCEKQPGNEDNGDDGAITLIPDSYDGVKRADVTYQLLVYSFADSDGDGIGDFNGIVSKMDYFNALGVSALWLSPIHPADSYHGYDITDYDAVNSEYGTMEDFENLVTKAHENNIKIYIDYVINHTGKGHSWFKTACENPLGDYGQYYLFSQNPFVDISNGKFLMLEKDEYSDGEWSTSGSAETVSAIFRFDLDWSDATVPTVTVNYAEKADEAEGTSSKFLYFGDGQCKRFYDDGDNKYHLTVNYNSNWGFLIRTSNTSWDNGTKYGAPSMTARISIGRPFALNNKTAADIMFTQQSYWFYQACFGSWMPDLNYGAVERCAESPAYKAVVASAKKWIDRGVDGFRLDAIKHVYNDVNKNPTFWNTFYTELNNYCQSSSVWKSNNSGELFMVGEDFEEAADAAKNYKGLPSLFEFSYWWRLTDAINNEQANNFIAKILAYRQMYAQYRNGAIASIKLSNHDENRTGSTLGQSLAKQKQAAAFLLTTEGKPFIYQGEELGYYGTKDNGDEWIRTPMKWTKSGKIADKLLNGKVDNAMLKAEISVEAQSADKESIFNVYELFSHVRNTYTALAQGVMSEHPTYGATSSRKSVACWYMTAGSQQALVVHNVSTSSPQVLQFTEDLSRPVATLGNVTVSHNGESYTLTLGTNSSAVFILKP